MIAMPEPIQLTIPRIRTPVLSSIQQQHFGKIVLAILKITVKGPRSLRMIQTIHFEFFELHVI